jgi:Transmembrane secretion effector
VAEPIAEIALEGAAGRRQLTALSTFSTITQLRAPASVRGRVVSVNTVILGSLYPLGAILQGKIADSVGLRVTTFTAGALLAAVLFVARVARPGLTAALDTPVSALE